MNLVSVTEAAPKFEGVVSGRYVKAWTTGNPAGYLVRVWAGPAEHGVYQLELSGYELNATINRALFECGVKT